MKKVIMQTEMPFEIVVRAVGFGFSDRDGTDLHTREIVGVTVDGKEFDSWDGVIDHMETLLDESSWH